MTQTSKTEIRSAYQRGERPQGLSFSLPSRAHQSFEKESNVNNLVSRYIKTGTYHDREGTRLPQYGDFTTGEDFREIQHKILEAQDLFSHLPSDIRERHANDAANFLDWLADPANRAEAQELGIIEPDPTPEQREDPQQPEAAFKEPQNTSEPESGQSPT